jgi:hypothetical protein
VLAVAESRLEGGVLAGPRSSAQAQVRTVPERDLLLSNTHSRRMSQRQGPQPHLSTSQSSSQHPLFDTYYDREQPSYAPPDTNFAPVPLASTYPGEQGRTRDDYGGGYSGAGAGAGAGIYGRNSGAAYGQAGQDHRPRKESGVPSDYRQQGRIATFFAAYRTRNQVSPDARDCCTGWETEDADWHGSLSNRTHISSCF